MSRVRALCVCLVVLLLSAGCVGGGQQDTIKALQTQVAELGAAKPTATEATQPTETPIAESTETAVPAPTQGTISSNFGAASEGIQVSDDEAAFVAELGQAMEGAGWTILRTLEDAVNVESPSARKYRFQYAYAEESIARIIIFSVWSGIGEANLSCETLTAINEINDQYNLAKVSVDADGDLWLESVHPVVGALDVAAFTEYLTWYESTEDAMVMGMLADYLQ